MAKLFTKDFKRKILSRFAPRIFYVFLNILYFTCKKNFHSKIEAKDIPRPVIFAFWHGELLALLRGYMDFRKSTAIDTIISDHFDGEMIAKVVSLYKGGSIRGSSTKGAIKALKSSFKSLSQNRDLGITPDGPKGPRHSVADGIVLISKKKNTPIVTFNCKPTSFWQLKSWDKFVIPKPFSTLDIFVGEPFYLDDLTMEESKKLIKERLNENAV